MSVEPSWSSPLPNMWNCWGPFTSKPWTQWYVCPNYCSQVSALIWIFMFRIKKNKENWFNFSSETTGERKHLRKLSNEAWPIQPKRLWQVFLNCATCQNPLVTRKKKKKSSCMRNAPTWTQIRLLEWLSQASMIQTFQCVPSFKTLTVLKKKNIAKFLCVILMLDRTTEAKNKDTKALSGQRPYGLAFLCIVFSLHTLLPLIL